MSALTETDKLIRKLRKKLRQIERLELLRPSALNEEEAFKVKQKNSIREELAQLLKDSPNETEQETSVQSVPDEVLSDGPHTSTLDAPDLSNSSLKDEAEEPQPPALESVQPPLGPSVPVNSDPVVESSHPLEEMKRSSPRKAVEASPMSSATPKKMSKKQTQQSASKNAPPQQETAAHSPATPAPKPWHETHSFLIRNLEGHSDLVTCVDLKDDYVISGSRDTMVQVWDAKTGSPMMNLRGHTNMVSCAQLLTDGESQALASDVLSIPPTRLALTGSVDCCLKLWDIEKGAALRSIYTFSGVTALCYLPVQQRCVIGSEGGKLEIYSLHEEEHNSNPLFSRKTFEGPVTSIKLRDNYLICSSSDGLISVWTINGSELNRIYLSEDLKSVRRQPILCLAPGQDDRIFYGDEGASIKSLSWKMGRVDKLRNHVHEFGLTNAICTTSSHLLSTSVNLDTGNSAVNIRSLADLNYLGSLNVCRGGAGRIVCLAASEDESGKNLVRIVAGGSRLTLLEAQLSTGSSRVTKGLCRPVYVAGLNEPAGESEDELDSSSEEEEDSSTNQEVEEPVPNSSNNSSWCQIL